MNGLFKKIASFVLACLLCMLGACGEPTSESILESESESITESESEVKPEGPGYTKETYEFTSIYTNSTTWTFPKYNEYLKHEGENIKKADVYSRIGDKNYLKIDLETNVDLVGFIHYYNVDDKTQENAEKFFIKANSDKFTTFLDAFRKGAQGAYKKTLTYISFQSVDDTKEGTVTVKEISISDRVIDTYEDWRISNGDTVLGTSPFYGGCITYLEKLNQDVYEYMDFDGNIQIDRYIDPDYDASQVVSDSVNLVNIYDLGREIQPSYYSRVTQENEYKPNYDPEDTDSYYQGLGGGVLYNPIQCGDFGNHTPQIIDYVWKEDYLYIIMKAQEWFFYTNIQANGYIEVTYYFDEGGAVMVDNVYTDFSCFVGEWNVALNSQETPATYFVYPLNYFYCETKQGLIFDPNTAEQNGLNQAKRSLKSTVTSANYFYGIDAKYMKTDWCAFTNANKFGVGIYMPNADEYVASRGRKSLNYYSEKMNSNYHEEFFTFADGEITPAYAAMNYSYINPSLHRKMVDFVPLEYTYALYVGDVEEMRTAFDKLEDKKVNAHLTDSTKGWPQK